MTIHQPASMHFLLNILSCLEQHALFDGYRLMLRLISMYLLILYMHRPTFIKILIVVMLYVSAI